MNYGGILFAVVILAAQTLVGAGLMGATFQGPGYQAGEESGRFGAATILIIVLSAAGAYIIGWWWCGIWLGAFLLRLAINRGKTHAYGREPDEPEINYGGFSEIAERMPAPVPKDIKLKELLDAGKSAEARAHAREMMEVALSLGNDIRAKEYSDWLRG